MREEAIRRRDYYNYVHSLENKITEKDSMLEKNAAEIAEKDSVIAEKDSVIAELKRQLEQLKHSK